MRHPVGRFALIGPALAVSACDRDPSAVLPTESEPRLHDSTADTSPTDFAFELYAWDGLEPGSRTLRWKGTNAGPSPDSPEQSERPFLGFARPYLLKWPLTRDGGLVVGHRHRASQVNPLAILTSPGLGLGDLASFAFENDIPAEVLPPEGCDSGPDCPDQLRFESGSYDFAVIAIDEQGTPRPYQPGWLDFDFNYPPESSIVIGAEWPRYTIEDEQGGSSTVSFAPGDTIPLGAYVTMRMTGFDRLEGSVANPDSFCCDQKLDPDAPDVLFQGQVRLVGDEGFRVCRFQSVFSAGDIADTLGFTAGPFAYTFVSRTSDEHDRRDPTPDTVEFVAGFRPRVLDLHPTEGQSMVLRNPLDGSGWPENEIPYDPPTFVTRYWDGARFLDQPGPGRQAASGHLFLLKPRFEGEADPRETGVAIRAWAYAMFSENDPENRIVSGRHESSDLSHYATSPQENVWPFSDDEAVELFVPALIWFNSALFDPGSDVEYLRQIGEWLRRHLADNTLRVVGRRTHDGDIYNLYDHVRPEPGGRFIPIDIERMGRRTEVAEVRFSIHLGLDPIGTGSIQRLWPDY